LGSTYRKTQVKDFSGFFDRESFPGYSSSVQHSADTYCPFVDSFNRFIYVCLSSHALGKIFFSCSLILFLFFCPECLENNGIF
jgi:hypothetical protein